MRTCLPIALLLAACARAPAPAPPPAKSPAAAPEAPCTLATPLVPGVPGSPGHLIPSPINPNGQSELSQHMRAMQEALRAARGAIERGERPAPLAARFRKIRCAWPTRPGDRDQAFDGMAVRFLAAVEGLDAAAAPARAQAYDRVLDGCRGCHERTCSGALVAIEALRLPANQSRPR